MTNKYIMPVYNAEKYLSESESVKRQTYLNWKFIMVDDKSSDDSLKLLYVLTIGINDKVRIINLKKIKVL